MRALELCYGSGERCAVSVTETTEPYPLAAGGHGWDVRPPPGLLALADEPGLGYVIRNGVYVMLLAPSRGELIAAAEALTPILRKQAAGLRKETCGMSTNQIQKLVCTAAAGMAVTARLALQAGSTASAATGAASASASGVAQGKVRIELTGRVLGPRGNRGRFILSGALADRGRFVDAPGLYIPRTLYGAKGAIRIIVGGTRGSWRITKGTKAYAGLHGRGHEHGLYDDTIHITMTGRVWR